MFLKPRKPKILLSKLQLEILDVYTYLMPSSGKNYTNPHIKSICKTLKGRHGRNISESWCYKNIKKLIRLGQIVRRKLTYNDPAGQIRSKLSLISFDFPGIRQLTDFGHRKAKRILKYMNAWLASKNKRFPDLSVNREPPYDHNAAMGVKELRALTEIVTSSI